MCVLEFCISQLRPLLETSTQGVLRLYIQLEAIFDSVATLKRTNECDFCQDPGSHCAVVVRVRVRVRARISNSAPSPRLRQEPAPYPCPYPYPNPNPEACRGMSGCNGPETPPQRWRTCIPRSSQSDPCPLCLSLILHVVQGVHTSGSEEHAGGV